MGLISDLKGKKEKAQWGFDLTDFKSASDFNTMLKKHKLYGGKREYGKDIIGDKRVSKGFVWKNKNLKLVTGNNPITGKYDNPKQRKPEKGYASYIGIEGNKRQVLNLVKDIKKRATGIKDESPHRRDFI